MARLAERFGVSRTPVREALLLLEREGVVRFERNRGVRVLETSAHDLEEIFTLRLLLEVPATYRACGLLTAEDLAALDRELAAMRRLAKAGDENAFMAHDTRFHEIVLTAAGNRRLAALIGQMRDFVRFRGASTVGRSRDLRAIHAEHVAVMTALRERDAGWPRAACAAICSTPRGCCSPRRAGASSRGRRSSRSRRSRRARREEPAEDVLGARQVTTHKGHRTDSVARDRSRRRSWRARCWSGPGPRADGRCGR